MAVWETSNFSCIFPFVAPPLSCWASGILPIENQDVSLVIQVYCSIDTMLDFVPLERMNGYKFKLLPIHIMVLIELPVFMNSKEVIQTGYDLATITFSQFKDKK